MPFGFCPANMLSHSKSSELHPKLFGIKNIYYSLKFLSHLIACIYPEKHVYVSETDACCKEKGFFLLHVNAHFACSISHSIFLVTGTRGLGEAHDWNNRVLQVRIQAVWQTFLCYVVYSAHLHNACS